MIPDECFEISTARSLLHLALSTALTAVPVVLAAMFLPLTWAWAPVWVLYAVVTGTVGSGCGSRPRVRPRRVLPAPLDPGRRRLRPPHRHCSCRTSRGSAAIGAPREDQPPGPRARPTSPHQGREGFAAAARRRTLGRSARGLVIPDARVRLARLPVVRGHRRTGAGRSNHFRPCDRSRPSCSRPAGTPGVGLGGRRGRRARRVIGGRSLSARWSRIRFYVGPYSCQRVAGHLHVAAAQRHDIPHYASRLVVAQGRVPDGRPAVRSGHRRAAPPHREHARRPPHRPQDPPLPGRRSHPGHRRGVPGVVPLRPHAGGGACGGWSRLLAVEERANGWYYTSN